MPDFLRFINELSVNGKPVEEDELEDDYTAEDSDEDEEDEETDEPGLDLTPPTEETQEGDNNNDDDSDDTDTDDDDDYTVEKVCKRHKRGNSRNGKRDPQHSF